MSINWLVGSLSGNLNLMITTRIQLVTLGLWLLDSTTPSSSIGLRTPDSQSGKASSILAEGTVNNTEVNTEVLCDTKLWNVAKIIRGRPEKKKSLMAKTAWFVFAKNAVYAKLSGL